MSAYELQRDSNVQRNNAWLAANGLGQGVVPPKPIKAKRKSDDEFNTLPTRASSRQSKSVVRFEKLGDDYFNYEPDSDDEREQLRAYAKSKRMRKQTTHFAPPILEGVARKRSTKPTGPVSALPTKSSTGQLPTALPRGEIICTAPVQSTNDASVKPYYAVGKKGQCKRCLDWFIIRRDGMLHMHHCRRVDRPPVDREHREPFKPFLPKL